METKVCYLLQTYADTIDFISDMHDKLWGKVEKQAKVAFDVELVKRRRSINESLSMFHTVGQVVLDKAVNDEKVSAFDHFQQGSSERFSRANGAT